MTRALATIGGACCGAVACYYGGAYLCCEFLWPESNLCGLPAVFVAAPLGLLAGAAVGYWATRPRTPPQE